MNVSKCVSIHTLRANFQLYKASPGHLFGDGLINGLDITFRMKAETPIKIVGGKAFE
jgi:hypothetical protein